jgi:putative ABC transport system substrate-binding protein
MLVGSTRRRFIRGAGTLVAASPWTLSACQTRASGPARKRLPLVGYFGTNTAQGDVANTDALREELGLLGYHEGQTIHIEWRYANNDQSQWAAIAQDLVGLRPTALVVSGVFAVASVLALSQTVPIVVVLPQILGAEPLIQLGYIQSQVRPGGNLTGLVGDTTTLAGKRLELLHEALPGATRLATLRDASQPDPYRPYPEWTSQVTSLSVSLSEELNDVFARFEQEQVALLAIASSGGRMFP